MIYIVVGCVCFFIAIVVAVVLAFLDKTPSSIKSSIVTQKLDNSDIELSKALENLTVCNGVLEGYKGND